MYNKAIYLPAYSVTGLLALEKGTKKYESDKTFRFYNKDENPVFEHNGVLVSAGHAYKRMNLKNDMNFDFSKGILLGDSGGYQIATGQIDPNGNYLEDIFNWLENNTNYALNIDVPMYTNIEGVMTLTKEEKIVISKKNFDYFSKNQSGKTKYLNVMHGRTQEDLKLWFDFVKQYENFEGGWALGSVNKDIFYILQSLFYIIKEGKIKKNDSHIIVHVLGISKVNEMIYVEYLQKALRENQYNITLTYDSSTPDISAGMGSYVLFVDHQKLKYLNLSKDYTSMNLNTPLPCSCPVCEGLTFNHFYGEESRNKNEGFITNTYNHISFHNLFKILEYKKVVESIINTDERKVYEDVLTPKHLFIFDVIDLLCSDIQNYSVLLRQKSNIMSEGKLKFDSLLTRRSLF
jgi:hypothetical protein